MQACCNDAGNTGERLSHCATFLFPHLEESAAVKEVGGLARLLCCRHRLLRQVQLGKHILRHRGDDPVFCRGAGSL